jgi:hypothetical protein
MFLVRDRVKQGTTTQGVGNVTFSSSFGGYQDFSVLGNGSKTFYTIEESTNWEVGIGTYNSNVLTRDTVIDSASGEGIPIYLSGSAVAFVSYPASGAVFTTGNIASVTGVSLGVSGISFNDGSTQTTAAASFSSVSGARIDLNDGRISTIESTGVATAANLATTGIVLYTGLYNTSGNLDSRISTIESTGVATSSDLNSVSSRVTTIEGSGVATAANLESTGSFNHSEIITVSGLVGGGVPDATGVKIDTNTSNISTNATNITSTGTTNAADIVTVSGLAGIFTHPSGAKIDTNTSNISTNTTNIASNLTGIYNTSGNLDTRISTNTSNISTNTTNIASNLTGIYNTSGNLDTRISTNTTNIAIVSGAANALTASGLTNVSNIAIVSGAANALTASGLTNVSNIAIASGAAIALTTSGIVGGSLLTSGTTTTPHTFDLSNGNFFTYTLATNPQVFHLANVTKGQKFVIRAEQDSGGGNAITWFSNNTVKWAGGSAPTVTTTAGKADVFGFIAVETGLFDGFVIGQNV